VSDATPDSEIPFELRQLVAQRLETMEQVEVLLLLARCAPRVWTAADVAAELRWPQRIAAQCLDDLTRVSLVRRTGSAAGAYEYAPGPEEQAGVAALMHLYETRPLMLGRLVYHRPQNVARSFADAFRLRPRRRE
jgi:hypothetical protein